MSHLLPTFVLRLVVAFLYFLPSVIALVRRAPHFGTGFMINLFLGWTVVGWMYSLAWAGFSDRGTIHHVVRLRPRPQGDPATAAVVELQRVA